MHDVDPISTSYKISNGIHRVIRNVNTDIVISSRDYEGIGVSSPVIVSAPVPPVMVS